MTAKMMTKEQIAEAFTAELKALLAKFNAEMEVNDEGQVDVTILTIQDDQRQWTEFNLGHFIGEHIL